MSITHAIKWSFLAEIASKAVTPLAFVILARLLTPEDYGVVAAATLAISFSQVFWEAGMGKALIHHRGDVPSAANAVFWVNTALGLVVAGLLIAISGPLAEHVFHDARVAPVLQVMSIQVLLGALASVHTSLLQKDMHFKRLFWVRLLTVSAPALLALPLAWYGMGYWALVAGSIVGQAVQVVMLWRASDWRPGFTFDSLIARRLARFGSWVAVSGLLSWFYLWADSLIVGMFLGSHNLGLYRTGNTLVLMIYGLLFGPLLPVLYSHFSQIQSSHEEIRRVLLKTVRLVTLVAIPVAFALYGFAEPIGDLVFGAEWQGVGLVIALMALVHGFSWVVGTNGEAYRAVGRPDYETKIMAGALLMYAVAYWVSVRHGLEAFLWTRVGLAMVALGIHLGVARVAVRFEVGRALLYVLKVSPVGIPLVLIGGNLEFFGHTYAQQLIVAVVLAGVFSLAYLWLIDLRVVVPETLSLLRQKSHARPPENS